MLEMEKVCVLMSTYNGDSFLEEQIDSLLAQKNVNLEIVVRDDSSSDNTVNILDRYQRMGVLKWYAGENLGYARSFLELIFIAPECKYYAFCDQDDYWESEKLVEAIDKIKNVNINTPALYFSRTQLADKTLNLIDYKPHRGIMKMDFACAFIGNNASGCTMVFNEELRNRVRLYNPITITVHDWWVYKVCIACNGYIYCDNNSYILYRQHENNAIGVACSRKDIWKKRIICNISNKGYRSIEASEIYYAYRYFMKAEQAQMLELMATYKNSYINRLKLLLNKKIRTQTFRGNIAFKLNVLMGRF